MKIAEVREQVSKAASDALLALDPYEPAIRALAIRQLVVEVEIQAAALGMMLTPPKPPRPERSNPDLLTIAQVAERTHTSDDTVKGWLRTKKLRRTKAGGRTLIAEADLQQFLKRSTEG